MSLRKSLTRLSFFLYFRKIRKKTKPLTWQSVSSEELSTIAIISANVPVPHMWARARVQVCQNSGSQMIVLRFTTLSARNRHWRNPRKKNYRERSNIKSAVSALTGSLPCNMAEERQRASALIRNRTHITWLCATKFNHYAMSSNQLNEKNGIWLVVFRHLQPYRTVVLGLFMLNINARHVIRDVFNANLWSIHIFAFYIDWSWNIFTLHIFCSMLIEQLVDLEKVRTDKLKFRTDLRDRVMDGWSVKQ